MVLQSVSLVKFSASTNGRQINVAATSTPGTLIHTASATAADQVYLYATNALSTPVTLTLEFGGTASTDLMIADVYGRNGNALVVSGSLLTGSVALRAYADTANALNLSGYVMRVVSE